MKFSVSSPGWPTNPDSRRHRHPDTKMNATQLSVRNIFSSFNWEKAHELELWQNIALISEKKHSPRCNKMILKETPELHFHPRTQLWQSLLQSAPPALSQGEIPRPCQLCPTAHVSLILPLLP